MVPVFGMKLACCPEVTPTTQSSVWVTGQHQNPIRMTSLESYMLLKAGLIGLQVINGSAFTLKKRT